jgi:3-deoxy-manno-octulosonate cytidylyltransferase (CMP-KDO synthetase)
MQALGVIPARLASTRLSRKPLQLLGGKPLIVRVAERVTEARVFDRVVVATDAGDVLTAVTSAGFEAVLTAASHESGTDRVVEVAAMPPFRRYEIVVNVQGDEPFLTTEALSGALFRVTRDGDDIGTAAAPLPLDALDDAARVKVVCDLRGRALYFSRSPIPHWRDGGTPPEGLYWQHIGLYAFTREALARWGTLEPTALERAERLEQLRALEHGLTIGVARLTEPAEPGIDTPEDLRRAEARWTVTARGT